MAKDFRFRGGYPAGDKTVDELGPPPAAWMPKPKPKPKAVEHPAEPAKQQRRRKAS